MPKKDFMDALAGKSDPEEKRKAIGSSFIDVFQDEEMKLVKSPAVKKSVYLVRERSIRTSLKVCLSMVPQ